MHKKTGHVIELRSRPSLPKPHKHTNALRLYAKLSTKKIIHEVPANRHKLHQHFQQILTHSQNGYGCHAISVAVPFRFSPYSKPFKFQVALQVMVMMLQAILGHNLIGEIQIPKPKCKDRCSGLDPLGQLLLCQVQKRILPRLRPHMCHENSLPLAHHSVF